jgi:hypothetical protein
MHSFACCGSSVAFSMDRSRSFLVFTSVDRDSNFNTFRYSFPWIKITLAFDKII